jgi:hypothetical protein
MVFFEDLRIRERFGSDRFQGRFSSCTIGLFSYSFKCRGYFGWRIQISLWFFFSSFRVCAIHVTK